MLTAMSRLLDSITQTDVPTLAYRSTNGLNECLYLAANEPSLGMYRIQEHVQGSVPKVVELRQNLQQMCERVDGASFDIEYDTSAVKEMAAVTQFSGVASAIERATELKRLLEERDRRAMAAQYPQTSSPAQTKVSHTSINSVDTDDLKPKSFDS